MISTKTGFAPVFAIPKTVPVAVCETVIISSPDLIFNAFKDKQIASVALPTPIQCLILRYFEKEFSNLSNSLELI